MSNHIELQDIINNVRDISNEDTDVFFSDDILTRFINQVLSDLCEYSKIYEKISKTRIQYPTDGIYLPSDFIDVIEFYVNNKRYNKISFGDLKNYVGENATNASNYIYYIRNNKLIVLSNQTEILTENSLIKDDELTIYYYAYYPKLVEYTDRIHTEFRRQNFVDIVSSGVLMRMKEKDEAYDEIVYWQKKYFIGREELKKENKRRSVGQVKWLIKHIKDNDRIIIEDK